MQFSPASCHFITLCSKYSPQCLVLRYPHSYVLPIMWETKFHTPIVKLVSYILFWKYLYCRVSSHSPNLIYSLIPKCICHMFQNSVFIECWRWRQYVPPKFWHRLPSAHGITTQKTNIKITMRISNLISIFFSVYWQLILTVIQLWWSMKWHP
jgi:hypothetical protein